jgi:hypothetical protein
MLHDAVWSKRDDVAVAVPMFEALGWYPSLLVEVNTKAT